MMCCRISYDFKRRVQAEIVALLRAHRYSDREIHAVGLGLEEAWANAVKHGNRNDPSKSVHVTYSVDGQRVWIRVEDEGEGFDPRQVPDPTLTENLHRLGGRGLLLMRRFMDHLEFNDRGNAVTMCLFRGRSARG